MKRLMFMLIFLPLFGCATNQKFDCPFKSGIRCQPIREIDKSVDKNAPLEVWMAPYQSKEGVYHYPAKIRFYP